MVQVLAVLLALNGCVGGQTGESPGEPEPDRVELDGGCQPPDCPAPTPDSLDAFGSLLPTGMGREVPPDGGIDEFVGKVDLVLAGELTGVGEGRNEYLFFPTCSDAATDVDERGSERPCDPTAPVYVSHVNLFVQPTTIFRGELEHAEAPIAVEFIWPRGAPLDRFFSTAPLGARLLLMAWRVREAEERARPLEDAGIPGNIAPNLFHVGRYGLVFEGSDGLVHESFGGEDFTQLVDASPPLSFQTATEIVMTSASKL
jgi:hypothetical protein